MKKNKEKINSKVLDKKFDDGKEDILEHFDTKNTVRRILVDFPEWMIVALDHEAKHLGISRQAIIKFWLNDKINETTPLLKSTG